MPYGNWELVEIIESQIKHFVFFRTGASKLLKELRPKAQLQAEGQRDGDQRQREEKVEKTARERKRRAMSKKRDWYIY